MVVVDEDAIKVLEWLEKLPLFFPAGIANVRGTGKAELFAESVMTAPPAGAGPLKVKINVAFDPLVTLAGLMLKEVNLGRPAAAPTVCSASGSMARSHTWWERLYLIRCPTKVCSKNVADDL